MAAMPCYKNDKPRLLNSTIIIVKVTIYALYSAVNIIIRELYNSSDKQCSYITSELCSQSSLEPQSLQLLLL